jgi:hypothetical protein
MHEPDLRIGEGLPQIREQRFMQLREDNGQYGNYSGTEARLYEVSPNT